MDAVGSSSDRILTTSPHLGSFCFSTHEPFQAVDLMQNLSLDSENKPNEAPLNQQQGFVSLPYGNYPSPASNAPTVGYDGQMLGLQEYHNSVPYYQSSTQSSRFTGTVEVNGPQGDAALSVEAAKNSPSSILTGQDATGNKVSNKVAQSYQKSSLNQKGSYRKGGYYPSVTPTYQDSRSSFDGSFIPSGRNNSGYQFPQYMNMQQARPTPGLGNSYGYVNNMYPQQGMYDQFGEFYGYAPYNYGSWKGGMGWPDISEKFTARRRPHGGFGYGKENVDGFNELNRGPRAKASKDQAVKEQNLKTEENGEENNSSSVVDIKQYNREDFPEKYLHAKFFVIKSYSEDDIHKSIKYGVWSSTLNGNKKLDTAFHEAKEKADYCPVFLFFSVNTSGQFIGLAEMVGPVDFNKTVGYWQQDKWIGCFNVKWHIVKDVPNTLLRHITLANNENKPVTNSRDTQEVHFEQGAQVVKIFKEFSSKTSILDDFEFYEGREKIIQERKAKQKQMNTKVANEKPLEIDAKDDTETAEKERSGISGLENDVVDATTTEVAEIKLGA